MNKKIEELKLFENRIFENQFLKVRMKNQEDDMDFRKLTHQKVAMHAMLEWGPRGAKVGLHYW